MDNICSCSNYLEYMEKFDYWGILVDSGSNVQWKHIRDVKKVYLQYTMSSCSYFTEHTCSK